MSKCFLDSKNISWLHRECAKSTFPFKVGLVGEAPILLWGDHLSVVRIKEDESVRRLNFGAELLSQLFCERVLTASSHVVHTYNLIFMPAL